MTTAVESTELKSTELKLKPGMTIEKVIGDKTLFLKPIPYGRLKDLVKVIFKAMDQFVNMSNKDIFIQFPKVFEENLPKIMPLMFSSKEHPFLNSDWIDENMSLVDMRDIIEKMIIINGLEDFLGQKGKLKIEASLPGIQQNK
jgi:hypothetical protein